MVKQVKTRRTKPATAAAFGSRELLLAGIGAVSLTRKQGIKLYGSLLEEGRSLQGRANAALNKAGKEISSGIDSARDRIEAAVKPIRGRAEKTLASAKSEVETRLQPVLARFGVATKAKAKPAKRVVRKPVARKPVAKRAVKARRRAA
jgi:poly(hydroxyalkanoate) granule-associated protein